MTTEEINKLKENAKLFDEYIDDKAYKNRPRRYENQYIAIESIPNYEYSYVLAYLMSQKNAKVKEHFKKAEYYKKNPEEYFETLNITDFYRDSIDLGYSSFLEEKKESDNELFFEIIDSNLTLNDIQKFEHDLNVEHIGLWKLISYLIDTNNLLVRTNQTITDKINNLTHEYCKLIDIEEAQKRINDIMQNPHKYATYCRDKDSNEKKLVPLSKNMPLKILDEDFLKDLGIIRTKDKDSYAKINYSVPTLKFKSEKVVNFPINLNLDKEELVAYISKIKDDFDHKGIDSKSPLEIFGEKLEKTKKPNSESILPQKIKDGLLTDNWKKAIADAFYIYDLYNYIENIYVNKLKMDSTYNRPSIHIEVSLASGISEAHNYFLKEGEVMKSKNKKSEELTKSDRIEKLNKLMKEYVDDEKYKELISGTKTNEITGMWDTIPTSPLFSTLEESLINEKTSNR